MFLGISLLLTSCELEDSLPDCDYNIQTEYWYGNAKQQNLFGDYIQSLDEYIFDDTGVLRWINKLPGKSCNGKNYSEANLPPGKYLIVAWGNLSSNNRIVNSEIGTTTLKEMMLHLDNPFSGKAIVSASQQSNTARVVQANSDRLYYGYRIITITEGRVNRYKIFMQHSHCMLNVNIRWKKGAPIDTKDFVLTLNDVPYTCKYLPEYIINGSAFAFYDEQVHADITDEHKFLPIVNPLRDHITHYTYASMNMMQNVSGRFICHRLQNDTHPILRLYAGDNALMKEIDLHKYFTTMDIELNKNLMQEFFIVVEIDGDNVSVMPATISDWQDGGTIGGVV